MGARSAPRTALTRRRRAVPIACALLTALTLLAPAIARGAGQPAHHLRTVKIVALAAADHSAATPRADQPVAPAPAPDRPLSSPARGSGEPAVAEPGTHDVDNARTRGPPGSR
jgi:hypothetical protein